MQSTSGVPLPPYLTVDSKRLFDSYNTAIPTGSAMTPRVASNSTITEGVRTGSHDQSLCCQYPLPVIIMNDSIIDGKNEFSGHIMKYENKRRNEGGGEPTGSWEKRGCEVVSSSFSCSS